MKAIEFNKITDTGKAFQELAVNAFGPSSQCEIIRADGYDALILGLSGVVTSERMPRSRIIPIGDNLAGLVRAKGKVFGVQVNKSIHPAVVTDRTTENGLHVTYLNGIQDRINPADPILTDFQKALLKKIAVLQNPIIGTHSSDGQGVGGELGHQQLGIAGVLNPGLMHGRHAVHDWADSTAGIAGAVTNPDIATIYDVCLTEGTREVREISAVLTKGVLIDHPSFHEVDEFDLGSTVQEFAAGLGVVAVGSQLGIDEVNNRIMANLQRL